MLAYRFYTAAVLACLFIGTPPPCVGDPLVLLVKTLAGDPSGSSGFADGIGNFASFNSPWGVALTSDGAAAFVVDSASNILRSVDVSAANVSTLSGTRGVRGSSDGALGVAKFDGPSGITISGNGAFALVCDTNNHLIRAVTLSPAATAGTVSTVAGTAASQGSTDGTGAGALFSFPRGVSMTSDALIAYVADTQNGLVRRILVPSRVVSESTLAGVVGSTTSTDGVGLSATFFRPVDIAVDESGQFLLVVSSWRGYRCA